MRQSDPIVFLDRDGTLNFDPGYLTNPDLLRLLDGVAVALARLKNAGFRLIVVSNQSAIGRGMASREDVDRTNNALQKLLLAEDQAAVVDSFLYCPHAPEELCLCRKPRTGLLDEIRAEMAFDPQVCWMVGDRLSDLEFAANVGIPFKQRLLVQTGEGSAQYARLQSQPLPRTCKDMQEAADIILA